jgi:hypothetical protein
MPFIKSSVNSLDVRYVIAAAAIIAAIVLIYLESTAGSVVSLYSPKTFSVEHGQVISIAIPGTNGTFSVLSYMTGALRSTLYISKHPLLMSQIFVLNISPGDIFNLSFSNTEYADVQIKAVAMNSTDVTIDVSPIAGLGIRRSSTSAFSPWPSAQESSTAASQQNIARQNTTAPVVSNSINGTAINSIGSPAGNSTSASNATMQGSTYTVPEIMHVVNSTSDGAIMENYNQLYIKNRACTAAAYNTTYWKYKNVAPSGIYAFGSVEPSIPKNYNITVVNTEPEIYSVKYLPAGVQGPAGNLLSITVNMSSQKVILAAFEQGLNYSSLESAFAYQSGISGFCGAYINP